jgi:hypothetical protein
MGGKPPIPPLKKGGVHRGLEEAEVDRAFDGERAVLGDLQSDTSDALHEVRVVHAVRLRELVLREDPAQVWRGEGEAP